MTCIAALPWWLPILGSWWLPIKLPCTHCPTPQAHNHVGLKQSTRMRSMADVGGSSSSGSAAADDLGGGQKGGSSADPGVVTIDLLDDADEEPGSTVRCLLSFVFMCANHAVVFVVMPCLYQTQMIDVLFC